MKRNVTPQIMIQHIKYNSVFSDILKIDKTSQTIRTLKPPLLLNSFCQLFEF